MTPRIVRNPMFSLAALSLSAAIGLSQQTPPATAATAPAPAAAPIQRQPPQNQDPRPAMRPRTIQRTMQPPMERDRMMREHGSFHGGMEGGPGSFRMGPGGMWWKNPAIVQRLSLTPEQTKKMDGIFQESRLQLIDLKANVEKQQVMLEPLLSANPLDTVKAMAQIDKVAQARADLEKANAKMLLGIRATLTPEQWTKLRDHGDGFSLQGGPGGPGAPGGRGRGPRPGTPGTSDFMEPISQP